MPSPEQHLFNMNKSGATHVTIISAVYPPEPVVSARMVYDLALFLTSRGNKVTVLCPQPSRPACADYRQHIFSGASILTIEEGIEVVRLPSFSAPKSALLPRCYESWSLGKHACQYLQNNMKMPDVLYVNVWPLLAQAQIIHFAKQSQLPVILQIMDIYPEALLRKLPAVLRDIVSIPLLKLDTWIAQQANAVVVISDNMRSKYIESRRVSEGLIETIPTWQDDFLFERTPTRTEACLRYNIPNDLFTFLYLGNIGPVAGVNFLIRAFHEAKIVNAQLVIVGDGSSKSDCIKLVEHLNVNRVHFVSDPDATNVPILQSMADVCLLPLNNGAGMSSIPSKLSAYLFSAKPVLATVDAECETAKVIHEANCGWVGEPENLPWLVAKMKAIANLPTHELESLGQCGRKYGLAHFSKAEGVKRLADVILTEANKNEFEQL